MSETFVDFVLTGILIVIQFLILDSHLDRIEQKIDALKENKDETN